jgi:hypothetical protein
MPDRIPCARNPPHRQIARRKANVCTVQIDLDTVAQPVELLFAKAGIGAGPACLSAIEASVRGQNQDIKNVIGSSVSAGVTSLNRLNIHLSNSDDRSSRP